MSELFPRSAEDLGDVFLPGAMLVLKKMTRAKPTKEGDIGRVFWPDTIVTLLQRDFTNEADVELVAVIAHIPSSGQSNVERLLGSIQIFSHDLLYVRMWWEPIESYRNFLNRRD